MNLAKFEPQDYRQLRSLAEVACKSGLMPQGMTPGKFTIIAIKGAELGIPIMQAIYSIHIINNKPAISSELMMALIRNRVPGAKIQFIENSDLACKISAKREQSEEASIFTFTIDDAKRAGLLSKGNWIQYPAAMLRARCISAMARAVFPDAIMGASYTPEELGAEVTISENGEEVVSGGMANIDENQQKQTHQNERPVPTNKSPNQILIEGLSEELRKRLKEKGYDTLRKAADFVEKFIKNGVVDEALAWDALKDPQESSKGPQEAAVEPKTDKPIVEGEIVENDKNEAMIEKKEELQRLSPELKEALKASKYKTTDEMFSFMDNHFWVEKAALDELKEEAQKKQA